jgi:hypothetical protein
MSLTWSMTCNLYDTAGTHVSGEYSLAHHIFVGHAVNCMSDLPRSPALHRPPIPSTRKNSPGLPSRTMFFVFFVPFSHNLNQMIIDRRTISIVPSQLAAPKSCGLTRLQLGFMVVRSRRESSPFFRRSPRCLLHIVPVGAPQRRSIISLLKQRKSA